MEDANYSECVKRLRELFDPTSLEKSTQEAMTEAIMELHPNDYAEFMETYKTELKSIRERIVSKVGDEFRKGFPF